MEYYKKQQKLNKIEWLFWIGLAIQMVSTLILGAMNGSFKVSSFAVLGSVFLTSSWMQIPWLIVSSGVFKKNHKGGGINEARSILHLMAVVILNISIVVMAITGSYSKLIP